jgi:hypothetical protein
MTTFTRVDHPFKVQSSAGATTNDFEVSTTGVIKLVNATNFGGAVGVSTNLSVGGTSKLTGAVTAEGAFTVSGAFTAKGTAAVSGAVSIGGATTITGAAAIGGALAVAGNTSLTGTLDAKAQVDMQVTVKALSSTVFLSLVSSTTPANFAAGSLVLVKSAAGVNFWIPACSSVW